MANLPPLRLGGFGFWILGFGFPSAFGCRDSHVTLRALGVFHPAVVR
jgi:hypothetical protein